MFNLLLLSSGSLLGQNILDALDGRRDRVHVVGINTIADSPCIYRCDRVYKAPPQASNDFEPLLLDLIGREAPDCVLPGRDDDVLFLARLARSHPSLAGILPVGAPEAAIIMNDKALSHRFAVEHGLPFASSFPIDDHNHEEALSWAADRYPLIAKPREGFGSHGIRILCHAGHLQALLRKSSGSLLLQEMLGFDHDRRTCIQDFLADADTGVPFFFHLPDDAQYAGQALIRPDGTIRDVFTTRSLMVLGRCESAEIVEDRDLHDITSAYARAIASFGWRGMFNLQCRKTENGYVAHELNGRMSGSTSARRWLGFDEPRLLFQAFQGHDIGPDPREVAGLQGMVRRMLTDYFIPSCAAAQFNDSGVWTSAPESALRPPR